MVLHNDSRMGGSHSSARRWWRHCSPPASAAPASSQDYPSKPIKFIVPTAPAGVGDMLARLFQQKLGELGNTATIVVENRAGAAGVIGTDAVAKARARRLHLPGRQSRRAGDAAAPAEDALRSAEGLRAGAARASRCRTSWWCIPRCRRRS